MHLDTPCHRWMVRVTYLKPLPVLYSYIPSTKYEQKSKTVDIFPHLINMLDISSEDLAIETAEDLTHLLQS